MKERFEAFKQRAIPKVGTRVTATGILQNGKQGMYLPFDGGEVYIYATRDSDIPKDNNLSDRFRDRLIAVTGTLQHYDSPSAHSDAETGVQVLPEHFFFDVADVTVAEALSN